MIANVLAVVGSAFGVIALLMASRDPLRQDTALAACCGIGIVCCGTALVLWVA